MKTVKPARTHTPQNVSESEAPVITAPVIAIRIFNTLVLLFFILFVWAHVAALAQTLRLSILIIMAKAVLELQFHVRKSTAQFVNTSAYAWLIALCGTVAALLFRPSDSMPDFSVATVMQAIGLAMLVYFITTLNRNSGMVFARQGIRRDGLYRFVRHPIYLAFMFSEYGYLLNHTTFYNLGVLALVTCFQVLRINEEERLLRDDEEFQVYAEQTRWRVIPGMF
ncbi:MAG: methyltransferase family protein [Planctomycetota bacterium]|jgi:protein-S-isoprenylcysteine O-methyltransferase Ste14